MAAAIVGSASIASAQLPTTNWLDYNLIAGTRLGIGPGLNLDGNYAVIEPGGLLTVAGQTFQLDHTPPFFLVAHQVSLNNSASVVDVYTNDLSGGGDSFEIRGTLTEPFPFFPLNIAIPPLPPGAFDPCTGLAGDLTVGNGGTASFNPGCYRDLKIGNDAVVTLKPGTFIFRNCTTGDRSVVMSQGHVDLICQNMLDTMVNTVLTPMNANQPPTDLQIWIAGASGSRIGINTILKATLVAPNDNALRIGQGVTFIGTGFAGGIELRGFHGPHPPTPTPIRTPTVTPTGGVTPPPNTPTPTPSRTPSVTPTGGITPTPSTPTPTPSRTPSTPTPTPSRTPGPTPTLPPGVTPTPTPQPTPTQPIVVPTPTPRPTPTLPPGVTPTPTPRPTPTLPPGVTPTPTRTPAPTPTLPPGVTPTPTPQLTATPFPTATNPVNPPTPGFRKKPWGRGKFNPGYWPSMGPRQNSRAPAMKKFIPKMKMK